jgi:hypothetical protein
MEDIDVEETKSNRAALKSAIVELYLAIKIRSADELSEMNEAMLDKERGKLMS